MLHSQSVEMSLNQQPERKRDRFRATLRKYPPLLPAHPTAGPSQPASSKSANASIASSILAEALEALQSNDREIVRASLWPTNAVGADAAFNEVHARARELQQRSKIKR
jgi:hypothetical protein